MLQGAFTLYSLLFAIENDMIDLNLCSALGVFTPFVGSFYGRAVTKNNMQWYRVRMER